MHAMNQFASPSPFIADQSDGFYVLCGATFSGQGQSTPTTITDDKGNTITDDKGNAITP